MKGSAAAGRDREVRIVVVYTYIKTFQCSIYPIGVYHMITALQFNPEQISQAAIQAKGKQRSHEHHRGLR